jgi:iron complex transport system substrate-binding protein
VNRRSSRIAGAATLIVASLALAACASGSSTTPAESKASAAAAVPFEYKDGRGTTVSLKTTPKTVVAQSSVAAALLDAGYQVSGAYGELTPGADGKLGYQAGSLNLKKLTVIGSTYGEFDTEKYALMNPDLLIDYTFDDKALWYVPAAQSEQILAVAPSVAVPGNYTSTDAAISTFVDLAGKLGADTTSAALVAEKADYETALKNVGTASAASGLKVVVMSPSADSLYVANPAYLPELETLSKAGLNLIDPVKAAKDVFTQYSWEEASEYSDADIILVDARTYDAQKADLAKISTWANLPAVKAGQVYPWYAAAPYSYKAYAKIYQEIADELAKSKKL